MFLWSSPFVTLFERKNGLEKKCRDLLVFFVTIPLLLLLLLHLNNKRVMRVRVDSSSPLVKKERRKQTNPVQFVRTGV